jgi:nucleotide-binding universal stress UspA family protein
MIRNIMVPLDGTRFAEAALPAAMYLAKRDNALLHLVKVWKPFASPLVDTSMWVQQFDEWEQVERENDRRYMAELARRVEKASGAPVSTKFLLGRPEDELIRWADDMDMDIVVMATHGDGPVSRAWVGSVADRVVRTSSVPVMLVRPVEENPEVDLSPGKPFRRILVPMDGSPLAEQALKKALLLGRGAEDIEITLLTVSGFPLSFPTPGGGIMDSEPFLKAQKDEAEAHLLRIAQHMASWGCTVTTRVVADPITWKAIVTFATANGFDLIAMATHGRGRVARALLGSVADKVMRSSTVPTLLVHPAETGKVGIQQQIESMPHEAWP